MSEKCKTFELKDEELEKVNGGISSSDAANTENIDRKCQAYVESGDDSGNCSWKNGYYAGRLNGSFADVRLANGSTVRVSLGNIKWCNWIG